MTRGWFRNRNISLALVGALLVGLLGQTALTQSSNNRDSIDASRMGPVRLSQTATAGPDGVLIEWRTDFEIDNLGFNVYRVFNGQRTQINRSIIPGSALIVGEGRPLYGGYYYSAFDPNGNLECEYYIEDVNTAGKQTTHDAMRPVFSTKTSQLDSFRASSNTEGFVGSAQREWAGTEQIESAQSFTGPIETQWAIAAMPSGEVLKIAVKNEGWYRITQPQLQTAGFIVAARDARNLRMFAAGIELAIRVSRDSGPLTSTDYIEFYGSGLDIISTDTRTYYLINGSQPGLRIKRLGEIVPDASPTPPPGPPTSDPPIKTRDVPSLRDWFFGAPTIFGNSSTVAESPSLEESNSESNSWSAESSSPEYSFRIDSPVAKPALSKANTGADANKELSSTTSLAVKGDSTQDRENLVRSSRSKGRRTLRGAALKSPAKLYRRHRRLHKRARSSAGYRNHASSSAAVTTAGPYFAYTALRKDRYVYISSLLNGTTENFFGDVVGDITPVTETLTLNNIETGAAGPAQLIVSLQGALLQYHQVTVTLNGTLLGVVTFFGLEHKEQTFAVPVSSLLEGTNSIQLKGTQPPSGPSDLSLVDHVQITYPRSFRATANTLRFSIRYNQSARIDGFTCNDARCSNVRILDITDPMLVKEVRPLVEPSGGGYALTVLAVPQGRGMRRLVALPATGTALAGSALTLNVPSTLNQSANAGRFLIIGYKDFINGANVPYLAQLVSQRTAEGFTVKVVDVEDVFDEFSFGVHSPQAITDFVSRARNTWNVAPQYVMLIGDGSYDPRNYQNLGDCDFVPAKLLDTNYTETVSDDSLIDFNNDGIADIPIGRLTARSAAQANLMLQKIVTFVPPNPQKALLVADQQCDCSGNNCYYFDFEQANDEVAAILQGLDPSIIIQKVYRADYCPNPPGARTALISNLNAGPAVVNYSGHGNVNSWAGGLFSTDDALALTNGSTLPLVVVMDCLNAYFVEPRLPGEGIAEGLLKATNGGAVASFASSGLTIPDGQHAMGNRLYQLLYGATPIRIGDAVIQAKANTIDIDVRRTWILMGDPTMRIRNYP